MRWLNYNLTRGDALRHDHRPPRTDPPVSLEHREIARTEPDAAAQEQQRKPRAAHAEAEQVRPRSQKQRPEREPEQIRLRAAQIMGAAPSGNGGQRKENRGVGPSCGLGDSLLSQGLSAWNRL